MSPDRDARFTQEDPDDDFDEDEAPRSIFSATWFRVVLVLLGIGVVGAVAVPYVLDVVTPTLETTASAPNTPSATSTPEPRAPVSSALSAQQQSAPAPSSPPAGSTPASEGPKPVTSTPKTAAPAIAAETPKSSPPAPKKEPARETAKSEASGMVAKGAVVEKPSPKKATAGKAADNGDYYVQVGAFKEQTMASSVAARLRQMNYSVVESTVRVGGGAAPVAALRPVPAAPAPRASATAGPDRYDVIVSGGSAADMNAKLNAKGLASEPAGEGVRIRPSLPLRDAVALSKDLGSEGFKVQVRRAGSTDPAPAAAAAAPPSRPAASGSDGDGQTLYRVRVGGFPDRAAAQTALRELQEKGYQPFIAKGRE